MSSVKQFTRVAATHSPEPRWTVDMLEEQYRKEQEFFDRHLATLQPDDGKELHNPARLESKNPHGEQHRSWKLDFKVGDVINEKGHRFTVAHIGKRSLILRPARD